MEGYKEATWAMALAVSKMEGKDYLGAQQCALKAQSKCPELEGVSEMLRVVEVYLRVEYKTNGVVDWYKVLDVHPQADEDAIRKQYKKLSMLLHPDKNTSVGAGGAFHLISDAYNLLKDKKLRQAYDEGTRPRMGMGFLLSTVPTHDQGGPTASSAAAAAPKSGIKRPKAPMTSFWTVCGSCRIQFEYNNKYRGCNIRCENCNAQFLAIDIGKPRFAGSRRPWQPKSSEQGPLRMGMGFQLSTVQTSSSVAPTPHRGSQPEVGGSSSSAAAARKSGNKRPKAPTTSFWTVCSSCRIQFEYNNKYRGCNLRCENCNAQFLAIDIGKPNFAGLRRPWQRKSSEQGPLNADKRERSDSEHDQKRSRIEEAHAVAEPDSKE